MSRSHHFSKKERAKKKKLKKDRKMQDRLERNKDKKELKESGDAPGSLENMLARVDHFGNVIPDAQINNEDDSQPPENKPETSEKSPKKEENEGQ